MKKILTYILCLSFLALTTSSIHAVEKKEKKTQKKTEQKKTADKKSSDKKTTSKKSDSKKSDKKKSSKKYDKLVDKNNNGIDDRKEKETQKKKDTKMKK